ncbi:MAG: hypothetical protein HUJ30_03365 [Gammaproteobacteria bacterium]|nr:hypothetical protein [Gammaproteobacteria bacterium]
MQVSLDTNFGYYLIHKYDDQGFTLLVPPQLADESASKQQTISHHLVLGLDYYRRWPVDSFEQLGSEHFDEILQAKPEVVLLGCGQITRFPKQEVLAPFYRLGIGVEMMSTAAACRTFNILSAEGRQVIAAMLLASS